MKTKLPLQFGLLIATTLIAGTLNAQIPIVSLPTSTVNASVRTVTGTNALAYYLTTLTNVPAGYDVTTGRYASWCAMPDVTIADRTTYSGVLCSSYETSSTTPNSNPIPPDLQTGNWNAVNYLINHKTNYATLGAFNLDLQYAIWYLIDGYYTRYTPLAGVIATNALQNGANYVPAPGEKMGVIIDFDQPLTDLPLAQDLIIEVTVPTPPAPLPASISGFAYIDDNNNGIFESTEIPLSGITITLTGTDYTGHTVSLSTSTKADGSYSFTGLLPSDSNGYTLTETPDTAPASNLLVLGKNTPGNLGGSAGVNLITTIPVGSGSVGTQYNFAELPRPLTTKPDDQTVCSGSPAILSVTASGHGTLSFQWRKNGNNLSDSDTISGSTSSTLTFASTTVSDTGSYDVLVTDAYGQVDSATAALTVNALSTLSLSKTDIACHGGKDGTVTAMVGGNIGTISIDGGAFVTANARNVFSGLPPGVHTVTARSPEGCDVTGSVTITEPTAALVLNSITVSNVACKGSSSGTLTIDASGGVGDLSYSIDNGTNFQPSNVFSNLIATNYSILITDSRGCMIAAATNITEPATALTITAVTKTDVACKGTATGSITVNATGGNGTLYYSIDQGATFGTANLFNNLPAKDYQVVVKDDGGCLLNETVTIAEPASVVTISLVSKTDISCAGANNGTITVQAAGGQGTIHLTINGVPWNANTFPGLAPGGYIITATDDNGCSANLGVNIIEPAPLSMNLASVDAGCNASKGVITASFSGGTSPYSLSINGSTPVPTTSPYSFASLAAGTYAVTLSDANGCSISQSVTLKGTCPLTLSCPLNAGQAGMPYSSALVAGGGLAPYTFAIISGALPSGLNLDANTGAITGTPTSAGAFTFVASVTDSQGTTVNASCSSGCTANVTWDFSTPVGVLGVSQTYTNSGVVITAYGYTNVNTHLPLALYGKSQGATETGLGLVGTSDYEIGNNEFIQLDLGQLISSNAQNPSLTINSVQYNEKYNVYGSSTPGTLGTLLVTNAILGNTAFSIPRFPTYRYVSVRAVCGDVLLTSLSASVPVSGCTITVAPAPVTLCLTGPCNTGRLGCAYSSALKVNGGTGPYSFVITSGSLPPGLTLNGSNGSIAGTPTKAGAYTFTAQVTDSQGNKAVGTFTITIGQSPLCIGCVSPGCGTVGIAYSGSISVNGGTPAYTYSISSGALPPGLTINPTTGAICGTPSAAGIFSFTITVTDSTPGAPQIGTTSCSIKISPAPLSIGCLANRTGQVGVSFSSGFTATGGVAPYTFSISCGCLPAGLTLNPATGLVSGIPTKASTFSFTVKVVDSTPGTPAVATAVCCIKVSPQPLTIGCLANTSAQVGNCFSSSFATSGGTPSLSFSMVSGCLPQGLSLNACSGTISGTPSCAGVYPFTVKVKDSTCPTNQFATASCSISVTAVPTGLQANPDATSIKLAWCPVKTGTSSTVTYTVSRSTSCGGSYSVIATGLTSTCYTDSSVLAGTTYYYVVSATIGGATSGYSSAVNASIGALPSPWKTTDIGCVGSAGSASYTSCKYSVSGSGADIWGTSDSFRYVYQYTCGDCTIIARVTSVQNTDLWAKAGLMIRECTSASSEHASIFITPGNGVAFQWRSCTGGGSYNANVAGLQAPCWLKIVRRCNSFSAYYSTDPACSDYSWKQVGTTQSISMATSASFGMAVTSHNNGAVCTATFSNVSVTP